MLTWDECVAAARRQNPDLSASRSALAAGKASYYGSFNGLMPRLSLSNSYGDSSSSDGSSRWQVQASASADLLNASRLASVRSASASLESAEAGLLGVSATLRFNLRRAFSRLLFAQENLQVAARVAAIRDRGSRLVSLRYDSGRESRGNMLRSRAQMLQAEADLSQAGRELATAQKTLDRQIGFDDFAAVTATGTLSSEAAAAPPDLRAAAERRPDLLSRRAALKASQASLSQARSPLWPSLSANYSRGRSGRAEFPSNRYNWSASGVLSFPLFGGGPTDAYYATAAARRNLERAEAELRAAQSEAVVDIDSTWSSLAGAADQVRVQAALLEAARQRNDEADVRYASGLLAFENWELIVTDRVNSERQALQARLSAADAEAAWARALGVGL